MEVEAGGTACPIDYKRAEVPAVQAAWPQAQIMSAVFASPSQ